VTDPLRTDLGADALPKFALSAVVYAERGDEILLLKRAEGSALAGQWYLPGGAVDPGETPEEAALRELHEEAGLAIDGELELIGCYPMWVYGHDFLQLSYRGRVAEGDVQISNEHEGARWVDPRDMRAFLTEEVMAEISRGDDRIDALLRHISRDLDRYLRRRAERPR
jgi:8-oxo-dGTP diphosphatase